MMYDTQMPKAIRISSDCLAEIAETSGRGGRRRGVADRLSRAACRLALSQIKSDPRGVGGEKWSHPGKNQTLRELNRTGIFGGPNF